jgi:hypothetical protein
MTINLFKVATSRRLMTIREKKCLLSTCDCEAEFTLNLINPYVLCENLQVQLDQLDQLDQAVRYRL